MAVVAVGLVLSRKSVVLEWRKKSLAALRGTKANRPKTSKRAAAIGIDVRNVLVLFIGHPLFLHLVQSSLDCLLELCIGLRP